MEVSGLNISVREQTDVAEARRQVEAMAGRIGFNDVDAGRAAIVVTELATNLINHAGGGEIVLDATECLQILALDKGSGMSDVEACMTDGFSTGGTRGEGLGAVRRQAETFEVYSRPGLGTATLVRLSADRKEIGRPDWSAVYLPYPGELACGDGWSARRDFEVATLMVVDGLGHGLLAREASVEASQTFDKHGHKPLPELLEYIHGALRKTRGAAMSVARVHPERIEFAGVGNVAGVVAAGGHTHKMISHNGTLGHIAKRFQAFIYPIQAPPILVLHSDGLGSSWSFDKYPGLIACDPALIAAVLYRDFNRGRDDVTVLAFRG